MSHMESVRLSINEHLMSVGEEILCVLEKQQQSGGEVCFVQLHVRVFVLERLRMAAQFMCSLFQREMETLYTSKLHNADGSPEHKKRSTSLGQKHPQPPWIKEEQEEEPDESTLTLIHNKMRCNTQSDFQESNDILRQEDPDPLEHHELIQRSELADESTMTLLAVKSEDADDEKRDAHGPIVTLLAVKSEHDHAENRETEHLANTSTAHMKTQADVDPTLADQLFSSHCSESDHTEDSDDWEETREDQSDLNTLTQQEEGQSLSLSNTTQDGTSSKQTNKSRNGRKICSCAVCGKTFDHMGTLRRHFKSHTGEKPFTCMVCVKGFGHKVDLKRHMTIHTGEKPFTCEVCGKGFGHIGDLKRHVRTHTGEKPFICTVCGKGVGRLFELNLHMRTHTGEKPFSCTVCGKSFRGSGNLSQHMRTHTGERPYTCAVCEQKFSLSTNLKRHMRTHSVPNNAKKTQSSTCELQGEPSDDARGNAEAGSVDPAEAPGSAGQEQYRDEGPASGGPCDRMQCLQ